MSVIIRLQGLPWSSSAASIRQYFKDLNIPPGGVHIIGGEKGDAFIAFSTDEDARQAMMLNLGNIDGSQIMLYLSSKTQMQQVIAEARGQSAGEPSFPPQHSSSSSQQSYTSQDSFAPTASVPSQSYPYPPSQMDAIQSHEYPKQESLEKQAPGNFDYHRYDSVYGQGRGYPQIDSSGKGSLSSEDSNSRPMTAFEKRHPTPGMGQIDKDTRSEPNAQFDPHKLISDLSKSGLLNPGIFSKPESDEQKPALKSDAAFPNERYGNNYPPDLYNRDPYSRGSFHQDGNETQPNRNVPQNEFNIRGSYDGRPDENNPQMYQHPGGIRDQYRPDRMENRNFEPKDGDQRSYPPEGRVPPNMPFNRNDSRAFPHSRPPPLLERPPLDEHHNQQDSYEWNPDNDPPFERRGPDQPPHRRSRFNPPPNQPAEDDYRSDQPHYDIHEPDHGGPHSVDKRPFDGAPNSRPMFDRPPVSRPLIDRPPDSRPPFDRPPNSRPQFDGPDSRPALNRPNDSRIMHESNREHFPDRGGPPFERFPSNQRPPFNREQHFPEREPPWRESSAPQDEERFRPPPHERPPFENDMDRPDNDARSGGGLLGSGPPGARPEGLSENYPPFSTPGGPRMQPPFRHGPRPPFDGDDGFNERRGPTRFGIRGMEHRGPRPPLLRPGMHEHGPRPHLDQFDRPPVDQDRRHPPIARVNPNDRVPGNNIPSLFDQEVNEPMKRQEDNRPFEPPRRPEFPSDADMRDPNNRPREIRDNKDSKRSDSDMRAKSSDDRRESREKDSRGSRESREKDSRDNRETRDLRDRYSRDRDRDRDRVRDRERERSRDKDREKSRDRDRHDRDRDRRRDDDRNRRDRRDERSDRDKDRDRRDIRDRVKDERRDSKGRDQFGRDVPRSKEELEKRSSDSQRTSSNTSSNQKYGKSSESNSNANVPKLGKTAEDTDSRGQKRPLTSTEITETDITVKVKGMPLHTNFRDVRRFFTGCEIPWEGIKSEKNEKGQMTGVIFIKFQNQRSFREGLNFHGKIFTDGSRIEILKCSNKDFDNCDPASKLQQTPEQEDSKRLKVGVALRTSQYIIQMKGLGINGKKVDVVEFFKGCEIAKNGEGIHIEYDIKNRCTGTAFIEMSTLSDFQTALTFDGKMFNSRLIRVSAGSLRDVEQLHERMREMMANKQSEEPDKRPLLPNPTNIEPNRILAPDGEYRNRITTNLHCVHLQGLPPHVVAKDIAKLFDGIDIAQRGIHIVHDSNGRPLGEAFVEFSDNSECEKALNMPDRCIADHEVSLKPIPKSEMVDILKQIRPPSRGMNYSPMHGPPSHGMGPPHGGPQGPRGPPPHSPHNGPPMHGPPPHNGPPPHGPPPHNGPPPHGPPPHNGPPPHGPPPHNGPPPHGPPPHGMRPPLGPPHGPPGPFQGRRFPVLIKGLPFTVSVREVSSMVQGYSPILESVRVMVGKDSGGTSALVSFRCIEDAEGVIRDMNNTYYRNKQLHVSPAPM